MTMKLGVLECGSCEPLKIAVHGAALGLAVVMGVYNAAAWLSRRQQHLAVNAVLYAALTAWEQQHVAHHLAELRAAILVRTRLSEEATGPGPADRLAA